GAQQGGAVVKNFAASCRAFDPRGSCQMDMRPCPLGSLLAGIKKCGIREKKCCFFSKKCYNRRMGHWSSWERDTFATYRPWVRIPYAPFFGGLRRQPAFCFATFF